MSGHLGPRLSRKPMHMFWLLDVSGSMGADGKIEALNAAMADAVESVRDAAAENPGVQVQVRVIAFAHEADWHVETPTDIDDFSWSDVQVVERGTTELGLAIDLATAAIREVSQSGRGLPPAMILVSDGRPTDLRAPSFGASLRALAEEPWGRKASRMAIGIGQDADMGALARFIGHDEIEPLRASNAQELRHYLRWASTIAVNEGTRPAAEWHETSTTAQSTGPAPPPSPRREATGDAPPPVADVEEEQTRAPATEATAATTRAPAMDVTDDVTRAPTADVADDVTRAPTAAVTDDPTTPPTTQAEEAHTTAPPGPPPTEAARTDLPPPTGAQSPRPTGAAPAGPPRTDLPPPPATRPPAPPPADDDDLVW